MLPINFVAVLVSAVVAFIIGFMWHGPLFGKVWMKLANITPTGNEKMSDMVPQMLWNLLGNLVMATILAGTLILVFSSSYMGEPTWYRGVITAVWLWLGLIVTVTSIDVIWMGRSAKLWMFECAYWLVAMAAMGAILAAWM